MLIRIYRWNKSTVGVKEAQMFLNVLRVMVLVWREMLPAALRASRRPAAWLLWRSPPADWDPKSPSPDTDLRTAQTHWGRFDWSDPSELEHQNSGVDGLYSISLINADHPGIWINMFTCFMIVIHPSPCCGPTRGTVVHQSSQGLAVPPVPVEVGDGELGHLVLDPAQQTLFGGQFLGVLIVLVLPHGHGDGVMQDQGPDQTQDQLQVPIYYCFWVWSPEEERDMMSCQHA